MGGSALFYYIFMVWNKDGKIWFSKEYVDKVLEEHIKPVLQAGTCFNCDGCGYENGCEDKTCGTYAAHKIWEIFKFEDTNNV
jgi:hypothetical protein